MKKYNRKAIFAELDEYDVFAKEHDYIEITGWINGEGYDVEINSSTSAQFSMTNGQFKALKKLIKELNK